MIDVYIVVGKTGVPGYKSIFFICKSAHGKWMDFLMIPCLRRLQPKHDKWDKYIPNS